MKIIDKETGIPQDYTLRSTTSGYAVARKNRDMAEFLGSEEAEEAKMLLENGEKSEDDYEWFQAG